MTNSINCVDFGAIQIPIEEQVSHANTWLSKIQGLVDRIIPTRWGRSWLSGTCQELLVAGSLAATSYYFTPSPLDRDLLLRGLLTQMIVNTYLRGISLLPTVRNNIILYPGLNMAKAHLFAKKSMVYPMALIHEMGHALAVYSLLNNGNPTITLSAYGEGTTTYKSNNPNFVGKLIGSKNIDIMITLGGPGMEFCAALVLLLMALKIDKLSQEVRAIFILSSFYNLKEQADYAISALDPTLSEMNGHDFVCLQKEGVDPYTAAIIVIAIPCIIVIGDIAQKCFSKKDSLEMNSPRSITYLETDAEVKMA